MKDLVFSLIEGYKSTLVAFGKFTVRQRQQLEYKNERLTKKNEDLNVKLARQIVYDKFLKEKMENLSLEMTRIEGLIKNFNKDSLLDEGRDQVRDTFSEVTTMLDAIIDDLS